MVNCVASLNTLAATYAGFGTYVGIATGNPGTGTAPANEASGGSPAYGRVATVWSSGGTGVQSGTAAQLQCPPGTYTFFIICSSSSGATMTDNGSISPISLGANGQIVVQPIYTQT